MSCADEAIGRVIKGAPSGSEIHQAVKEVPGSLRSVADANEQAYRRDALLGRSGNPERQTKFSVPWIDGRGPAHLNAEHRIRFISDSGPRKGGPRPYPSVDPGMIKFLGFEQIFKNLLTGLLTGGKSGFDLGHNFTQ